MSRTDISSIVSPKQTLWSWILESKPLSSDSNAPGFTDALTKEHISFKSLKDYATTLSSALVTNYNINENDTVVVFAKNSIWYPVATLAAARVGAVACGISPEYTNDECCYSLKTSKAKVIFATVDNFDIASAAAKKAGLRQRMSCCSKVPGKASRASKVYSKAQRLSPRHLPSK